MRRLIYFKTLTTLNNFCIISQGVGSPLSVSQFEVVRWGRWCARYSGPDLLRHHRVRLCPLRCDWWWCLSWRLLGSLPTGTPDQAGARPEQCQPHHTGGFLLPAASTLPVHQYTVRDMHNYQTHWIYWLSYTLICLIFIYIYWFSFLFTKQGLNFTRVKNVGNSLRLTCKATSLTSMRLMMMMMMMMMMRMMGMMMTWSVDSSAGVVWGAVEASWSSLPAVSSKDHGQHFRFLWSASSSSLTSRTAATLTHDGALTSLEWRSEEDSRAPVWQM